MSSKGRLFVVSGPSGVGKTTLIDRFLREDRQTRFSVSCTTRKKREHEEEGKDYYFIDEDTFRQRVAQGGFIEWEEVHGYLYGTPKAEVLGPLKDGIDVLLDVDVKGALRIKEQCPAACLLFIEPPSVEELIRRLSGRGEKEIEKRMERVRQEMALADAFTYRIRNDNIGTAYKAFKKAVMSSREQVHGKDNR